MLDVNCTDESTSEITDAISHSLRIIFLDNIEEWIYVQCTDSGGSGTKLVLSAVMHERDLVGYFYLISTCSLYNLQNCLRKAAIHVLGEVGVDKNGQPVMNCMQMLHRAYNLQNWQEFDELKQLWVYLTANDGGENLLTIF